MSGAAAPNPAAEPTIDLTTFGWRSGRPHRVEIWWFEIGGRIIVTGTPGPRDWLANIRADARVVVHTRAGDLPGTATEVLDPTLRRAILSHPVTRWYREQVDLDELVTDAPLIELHLGSVGAHEPGDPPADVDRA